MRQPARIPLAALAALLACAACAPARAAEEGAPAETSPPVIARAEGRLVIATPGSWTPQPSGYTYTWSSCDATGGCSDVSTAASYTPSPEDAGRTIRVHVTATGTGEDAPSQTAASNSLYVEPAAGMTVYACREPDGTPAPAAGWTGDGSGAYHYLDTPAAGENCPEGEGLEAALGGNAAHQANTDWARWTFTAPPGMSVAAGTVWRYEQTKGSCDSNACADDWLSSPAWEYGPDTYDQCSPAFGCASAGAPEPWDAPSNQIQIPAGRLPAQNLYFEAGCGGANGYSCQPSQPGEGPWGYEPLAMLRVYAATLRLEGGATPVITGASGPLLSGGTLTGAQTLTVSAAAGAPGIYAAVLHIDGQPAQASILNTSQGACASHGQTTDSTLSYTLTEPCPSQATNTIQLDTSTLTDGTHTLQVCATTAAQTQTCQPPTTIHTLNHPPTQNPAATTTGGSNPTTSSETPRACRLTLTTPTTRPHARAHPRRHTRRHRRHAKTKTKKTNTKVTVTRTWPDTQLTITGTATPDTTLRLLENNRPLATTTTTPHGTWTLTAPPAGQRALQVDCPAEHLTIQENVAPRLTLHAQSQPHAHLQFTGTINTPPGTPPPLILVQAHGPHGWQTLGQPARPHNGRWHLAYQTTTRDAGYTFPFRALTPQQPRAAPAHTPPLRLTIHP